MPHDRDVEQLLPHLILWLLPGHNQRRIAQIRQQLEPSAAADPHALLQALSSFPRVQPQLAALCRQALHDPWRLPFADQIHRHLLWAEHPKHWLLTPEQQPECLAEIADPPLLLCVSGQHQALDSPALAVVGSRNVTPEGRHNASHWSAHLAHQGLNIISGLARGVDAYAHQGVLDARERGASGATFAVLAQGLDQIYPPEHKSLAERVCEQGALLSEYPLGASPLPRNFPARNRIVTGLSLGVLVVEAALRSGSLVSARHALEQGREVMAIPGSVRRKQSEGCHQLIRQGAALVTHPDEVLAELRLPLQQIIQATDGLSPFVAGSGVSESGVSKHLQPLYQLISDVPQTADQLLLQLDCETAEGLALLQELELDGLIEQCPGGWCRSA
ncbi:DNA-processing protein DprA [Marinospirillum alkaliphilum]|uniref:DNA processing protein n=1 Tax=Marinospirillum alkaliphilum DSM 21637 TaxID=1122209 RepID=A0A1K1ZWN8_9GAMM|nr:DNA-processing protein DprA [Marinospirillum alkaliphilum]SFX78543.1 DNA processing protein [Marinospirillum alkaliphilum DSM 21637]